MQAGLFSAVSAAFIVDVQSKLEPDPNDMTAAYMRILIHTMNDSLFPDADPNSATWTGPPPGIVTVQALLYASLATSLFAAFVAMLGKQWVNRYLRNRGGSAAEKSWDRQRKLDGFKRWHFRPAIESLPVMLQLALLLLGSALSLYLWTISRTVAGVTLAFTIFGVTLYVFLTLAATLYYDCPYQTPPSILTQIIIEHLKDSAAARSLRSLIASLPSINDLRRTLKHLRSGVRHVLESRGCIPAVAEEAEQIPLAAVLEQPTQIFENNLFDWKACEADIRCISWMLESTTDPDVILSTVRFAADMIWYPEIAGALSPHVLADLFFDCFSEGRSIPGKSEHAISIGMALASVLSIRLSIGLEDEGLRLLCNRINSAEFDFQLERSSMFAIMAVKFTTATCPRRERGESRMAYSSASNLSTVEKLWLSRVVLQMIWRWRRVEDAPVLLPIRVDGFLKGSMKDGDEIPTILRTNFFLTMAIALGLRVDIHDLYAPNTLCVVPSPFPSNFLIGP